MRKLLDGTHIQAYKEKLGKTNGIFGECVEFLADEILDTEGLVDDEEGDDF